MRYTAMLAASAAVLAVLTLPRDGRGEDASLAAAPAQPAAQEDFRWSGQVARGGEIEIRGLLGSVRAEPSSGDRVEVVGRRMGRDAEQVRVEVVEGGDGVVICTIYPRRESRRRGGEERETRRQRADGACGEENSGGELDLDSDEARIDFTVRVPAGVRFTARTVDGDIEANGLRGPVDAASVTGDVRVSTTGTARAATVSGNVEATFGATDGSEMEFASVSGNVVVRVPPALGARVQANTLAGRIESDFDLRIRPGGDDDGDEERFVRIGQRASGTIGGGGPELSLSTISGNIRVLRGG